MTETVAQLAYDEAKTAISAQRETLDSLRSRAGTLLAAASLVTSFLGGQALAKPVLASSVTSRSHINADGWIAIGSFVAVAILTIAILLPYDFGFVMSAKAILREEGRGKDLAEVQKELATDYETNHDDNQKKLNLLFWCLRIACVLLAVETIAWILNLRW